MSSNKIVLLIGNTSTEIQGKLDKLVYKELKQVLGFRPDNAAFMMKQSADKAKREGRKWAWDGFVSTVCYSRRFCKCPIKKEGTHFPTGLVTKARQFLSDNGIQSICVDQRLKADSSLKLTLADELEKRDYQETVVKDAIKQQRGIVQAATGSGKTAIAAWLIAELGVSPFVFYVPSIDLLTQAKAEISRFVRQNGSNLSVGAIGGGQFDIQDINVMTVQTAIRSLGEKWVRFDDDDKAVKDTNISKLHREEIKSLIMDAKGCIGDEVQHWAAETCQIISDYSVGCQYKYGFSATPWRDKGDDILIEACFGKTIAKISASFLIQRDYLVKPNIYFVPVKHPRYPYKAYAKLYEQSIVENTQRNDYIAKIASNFASQDKVVLILCRHINHGNMLEQMIDGSVFLCGKHSGADRKIHLDKMRAREASVTIATSIFDEGIDCRPLDTLILAGSGKSQTRALQRIGRTLRPYPGKTSATIVDFDDSCKYMNNHSYKRRKIYQTEPEFHIEDLVI